MARVRYMKKRIQHNKLVYQEYVKNYVRRPAVMILYFNESTICNMYRTVDCKTIFFVDWMHYVELVMACAAGRVT